MNRDRARNLFFILEFSFQNGAYRTPNEITRFAVSIADEAFAQRDWALLFQSGQILSGIPGAQAAAQYYTALSANPNGKGDRQTALHLFEQVVRSGSAYMARALVSMGGLARNIKDVHAQGELFTSAAKVWRSTSAIDIFAATHSQKMLAVTMSDEGNHQGALNILESGYPIAYAARLSHQTVYLDYLNSLAVELSATGRVSEAARVSARVLASPYAVHYPEWQETRREIEAKTCTASRSTITISDPPMSSVPCHLSPSSRYPNVVDFMARTKKSSAQQSAASSPKPEKAFSDLSADEKRLAIARMILNQASESELNEIWNQCGEALKSRTAIDLILTHADDALLEKVHEALRRKPNQTDDGR